MSNYAMHEVVGSVSYNGTTPAALPLAPFANVPEFTNMDENPVTLLAVPTPGWYRLTFDVQIVLSSALQNKFSTIIPKVGQNTWVEASRAYGVVVHGETNCYRFTMNTLISIADTENENISLLWSTEAGTAKSGTVSGLLTLELVEEVLPEA